MTPPIPVIPAPAVVSEDDFAPPPPFSHPSSYHFASTSISISTCKSTSSSSRPSDSQQQPHPSKSSISTASDIPDRTPCSAQSSPTRQVERRPLGNLGSNCPTDRSVASFAPSANDKAITSTCTSAPPTSSSSLQPTASVVPVPVPGSDSIFDHEIDSQSARPAGLQPFAIDCPSSGPAHGIDKSTPQQRISDAHSSSRLISDGSDNDNVNVTDPNIVLSGTRHADTPLVPAAADTPLYPSQSSRHPENAPTFEQGTSDAPIAQSTVTTVPTSTPTSTSINLPPIRSLPLHLPPTPLAPSRLQSHPPPPSSVFVTPAPIRTRPSENSIHPNHYPYSQHQHPPIGATPGPSSLPYGSLYPHAYFQTPSGPSTGQRQSIYAHPYYTTPSHTREYPYPGYHLETPPTMARKKAATKAEAAPKAKVGNAKTTPKAAAKGPSPASNKQPRARASGKKAAEPITPAPKRSGKKAPSSSVPRRAAPSATYRAGATEGELEDDDEADLEDVDDFDETPIKVPGGRTGAAPPSMDAYYAGNIILRVGKEPKPLTAPFRTKELLRESMLSGNLAGLAGPTKWTVGDGYPASFLAQECLTACHKDGGPQAQVESASSQAKNIIANASAVAAEEAARDKALAQAAHATTAKEAQKYRSIANSHQQAATKLFNKSCPKASANPADYLYSDPPAQRGSFEDHQIATLEVLWVIGHTPTAPQKQALGAWFGVSSTRINIWFQNKRGEVAKARAEEKEAREKGEFKPRPYPTDRTPGKMSFDPMTNKWRPLTQAIIDRLAKPVADCEAVALAIMNSWVTRDEFLAANPDWHIYNPDIVRKHVVVEGEVQVPVKEVKWYHIPLRRSPEWYVMMGIPEAGIKSWVTKQRTQIRAGKQADLAFADMLGVTLDLHNLDVKHDEKVSNPLGELDILMLQRDAEVGIRVYRQPRPKVEKKRGSITHEELLQLIPTDPPSSSPDWPVSDLPSSPEHRIVTIDESGDEPDDPQRVAVQSTNGRRTKRKQGLEDATSGQRTRFAPEHTPVRPGKGPGRVLGAVDNNASIVSPSNTGIEGRKYLFNSPTGPLTTVKSHGRGKTMDQIIDAAPAKAKQGAKGKGAKSKSPAVNDENAYSTQKQPAPQKGRKRAADTMEQAIERPAKRQNQRLNVRAPVPSAVRSAPADDSDSDDDDEEETAPASPSTGAVTGAITSRFANISPGSAHYADMSFDRHLVFDIPQGRRDLGMLRHRASDAREKKHDRENSARQYWQYHTEAALGISIDKVPFSVQQAYRDDDESLMPVDIEVDEMHLTPRAGCDSAHRTPGVSLSTSSSPPDLLHTPVNGEEYASRSIMNPTAGGRIEDSIRDIYNTPQAHGYRTHPTLLNDSSMVAKQRKLPFDNEQAPIAGPSNQRLAPGYEPREHGYTDGQMQRDHDARRLMQQRKHQVQPKRAGRPQMDADAGRDALVSAAGQDVLQGAHDLMAFFAKGA